MVATFGPVFGPWASAHPKLLFNIPTYAIGRRRSVITAQDPSTALIER